MRKPLTAYTTKKYFLEHIVKILDFMDRFPWEIVIDFSIIGIINAGMIEKKIQPFFSEIFIYLS